MKNMIDNTPFSGLSSDKMNNYKNRYKKHDLAKLLVSALLVYFSQISLSKAEDDLSIVGSIHAESAVLGSWLSRDSAQATGLNSTDLDPTSFWGVRAGVDFAMNQFLWVGGEVSVSWLQEKVVYFTGEQAEMKRQGEAGSRIAFMPALRARMDFPLDCRWIIEGEAAVGLTFWGATRGGPSRLSDDPRWGGSWRAQLGLRYALNTQVHLSLGFGYQEQAATEDDTVRGFAALPLALGLRGGF